MSDVGRATGQRLLDFRLGLVAILIRPVIVNATDVAVGNCRYADTSAAFL